jgi:hypothetical protein
VNADASVDKVLTETMVRNNQEQDPLQIKHAWITSTKGGEESQTLHGESAHAAQYMMYACNVAAFLSEVQQ